MNDKTDTKRKTDTAYALSQYSALDASAQCLMSAFFQMAAAFIISMHQIQVQNVSEEEQE